MNLQREPQCKCGHDPVDHSTDGCAWCDCKETHGWEKPQDLQREQELKRILESELTNGGPDNLRRRLRRLIKQCESEAVREFMAKIDDELKDPKEKEVELAAAEYLKRIRKLLPFALKYIENRSNKK